MSKWNFSSILTAIFLIISTFSDLFLDPLLNDLSNKVENFKILPLGSLLSCILDKI